MVNEGFANFVVVFFLSYIVIGLLAIAAYVMFGDYEEVPSKDNN